MIEVALVFNSSGAPIYWHIPSGASGGAIPDSRQLWHVLWDSRGDLGGVAHTHPWNGEAAPSHTDITTFAALEAGLGKRLLWPIVTMTEVRYFVSNLYTGQIVETPSTFDEERWWKEQVTEMRRLSHAEGENKCPKL